MGVRWLAESGEERVYDVHHALVRLTGRDPLLPERADGAAYAAAVRAAWADGRTDRAPAVVGDLVCRVRRRARFCVDEGGGRVRVAFDPPSPGSSWPSVRRPAVGGLTRRSALKDTQRSRVGWGGRPVSRKARLAHRTKTR
ncbi:hypothetical protein [Streptomyces sp. NRRL F-4474]|uniref:hypothetical protein n=1 Tax=Streptomyces sp. NRRL F-4474 TaxID=1463851 RepID=UPI0004C84CA8|nr:hypothetical protein [Streptomyces sp. NRRL F-4474]